MWLWTRLRVRVRNRNPATPTRGPTFRGRRTPQVAPSSVSPIPAGSSEYGNRRVTRPNAHPAEPSWCWTRSRTYLFFGGYPAGVERWDDEDDWRSYIEDGIVQRNVERDILSLTRVDKPSLLSSLLELGSSYSGQVMSYNKMLGQLQDAGNTTTLARYLTLLTGAGLLAGLGNYSPKTHRGRASSPKLNVLNTALMTASSGYTFQEARADRSFWSRIVESAVGAHLHNTRASGVRLHYWRRNGLEVDFVLARGPRLTAIEVKTGLRRGAVSGMDEFRRRFNPTRTEVVGTGGVALHEFLSEPAGYWLEKER